MKAIYNVLLSFSLLILSIVLSSCEIADYPYFIKESHIRAHFSGDVMSGNKDTPYTYIWTEDDFSEMIPEGKYKILSEAVPKSVASTFDSIAIDKKTKITIYSKPDFQGEIVLEEEGPLVIYNVLWISDSRYNYLLEEEWDEDFQELFPFEKRIWSDIDMHAWASGSLILEHK